jgi:phosphoribosylglycinamide formyltransferase-1
VSGPVRVGVAISGSGSNLQALLDAARAPDAPFTVAVVVSDRARAFGLQRATDAGVPTVYLPAAGRSRDAYDTALADCLRTHEVDWVCLAGFMRLVGAPLLTAFPQRVLNIHPSLLPAFPGLDAAKQALDHGVRVTGATVHLVDTGMDTGPIVVQGAVPVQPDDTLATLQQRIHTVEHQIYPLAVRWAAEGRLQVEGRRVQVDLPLGTPAALWVP